MTRTKFRQADLFADFLERHLHRHVAAHLLGGDADDVAHKAGPFLQFDAGDHVGQVIGKRRMIGTVKDHK